VATKSIKLTKGGHGCHELQDCHPAWIFRHAALPQVVYTQVSGAE